MTFAPKQSLAAALIAFPALIALRELTDMLGLWVYTWHDNVVLSGINAFAIVIAVLLLWKRRG